MPTLAVLLRPRSEDLFEKTKTHISLRKQPKTAKYPGIPWFFSGIPGYYRGSNRGLAVWRAGRPTLADLLQVEKLGTLAVLLSKCRTLAKGTPGAVDAKNAFPRGLFGGAGAGPMVGTDLACKLGEARRRSHYAPRVR